MTIKQYVDKSIFQYPSLYRTKSYQESRLLVLDHVFLTIGNGLEWNKAGFIADYGCRKNSKIEEIVFPKNYFTDKMWELNLNTENVKEVQELLKDYYSYIHKTSRYNNTQLIILCNDEELIKDIFKKYSLPDEMHKAFFKFLKKPYEPTPYEIEFNSIDERSPYPICEYSALVEMINKRTNSCHIKNFNLTNIQQDYIDAGIDIAKHTLDFYNDPEKVKRHSYHPNKSFKEFKRCYNKDPEKYRKDREEAGMLPKHTIEQWCEIWWQKFCEEQIKYCEDFIKMYDK